MPAVSRVVQAAVLAATVGHLSAPLAAFAAPVPVPVPVAAHLADYASQPPAQSSAAAIPQSQEFSVEPSSKDAAVVDHTASVVRRQDDDNAAAGLAQQLELLQSSSAASGPLAALLQPLIDALTAFLNSMKPTPAALAIGPAGEKGNKFNNNDALETALKNLANQLKSTLDQLVAMFSTGPLSTLPLGDLSQLMYVIKCIVIEIINMSTNFVDDVLTNNAITALQDLLQELQGVSATGASVVPCKQGFIVGYMFCL